MDSLSADVLRQHSRSSHEQPASRRASVSSRLHFARKPTYVMPVDGYLEAIHLTDRENINTSRLKHTSTVSALLAGFALEAYVQMEIEDGIPSWLMVLFAVNTTTLIAVNLFALLTSVCLLPTITSYNVIVARRLKEDGRRISREHSPHIRFHKYIITAWLASTVVGIEFFLFEVIVVSWVHFYIKCKMAAACVTVTLVPTMVLFAIFARILHEGVIDMHLAPLKTVLDRGMEETDLLLPPEIPDDLFGDGERYFDADRSSRSVSEDEPEPESHTPRSTRSNKR